MEQKTNIVLIGMPGVGKSTRRNTCKGAGIQLPGCGFTDTGAGGKASA